MQPVLSWGHNPGQRAIKNTISTPAGTRKDLAPFPAVIAPYQTADDLGLQRATAALEATVDGRRYLVGQFAERSPLASRQLVDGRLADDSPVYQAFARASVQLAKIKGRPPVVIASALPAAWRTDDGEKQLERQIRAGLHDLVDVKAVIIQSEPNAVVASELLDDGGQLKNGVDPAIARGLVCVGDLGGGTLNRSVLEALQVLPGQSASPLLGSRQVVETLMQQAGIVQFVDAERRLEAAAAHPGNDGPADRLITQYGEAVVAELQRAWASFRPAAYIFAGGTVLWVAQALSRAFPRSRIVDKPQQAIAVGLWRTARRKAAKL